MSVAGALIGKSIGAYGRKPNIPILPPIDAGVVQRDTIAGNTAVLPGAQAMATQINAFNYAEQLAQTKKALEFALPGGFGKLQDITRSQMAGEIPEDVQSQLLRTGASRAFAGGTAGSVFARNATLRDFGMNSMQQQAMGFQNFERLNALSPRAPLFDLSSMLFTPQQRLSFAISERDAQFQRNLLAEQVEAAPDPATAALGKEIDRFFNTWAQAGMTALGGGGG